MKKSISAFLAVLLALNVTALSGCGSKQEDPGEPPAEVVAGTDDISSGDTISETEDNLGQKRNSDGAYNGDILEDAVSVRIGRNGSKEWPVSMYNNDATATMLDYLSDSGLLFPAYTYDEEQGFVAQSVRGSYSRDDETAIADVKAGELYLFSGGQLRFYFKDMEGADITATPVGFYSDTEGLTEAVQEAYESNKGDTWGVDVYFWITKTLQ